MPGTQSYRRFWNKISKCIKGVAVTKKSKRVGGEQILFMPYALGSFTSSEFVVMTPTDTVSLH